MNRKFGETRNVLKEVAGFVYRQFTDLGASFLPTARGADLPLPIRDKEKKKTQHEDRSKRKDLETL